MVSLRDHYKDVPDPKSIEWKQGKLFRDFRHPYSDQDVTWSLENDKKKNSENYYTRHRPRGVIGLVQLSCRVAAERTRVNR